MHEQRTDEDPGDGRQRADQAEADAERLDRLVLDAIERSPPLADAPRIWVGTVEDYHDGTPHGRWIDAAREHRDVDADIEGMLSRSPHARAQGTVPHWHVFAADGFGRHQLQADLPLYEIVRRARCAQEDARAYAAWAGFKPDDREHCLRFYDVFEGRFDSVHDWVTLHVEQAGYDRLLDERLPSTIRPFVDIDIDGLGHDLLASGEIIAKRDSHRGGVWIFHPGKRRREMQGSLSYIPHQTM